MRVEGLGFGFTLNPKPLKAHHEAGAAGTRRGDAGSRETGAGLRGASRFQGSGFRVQG